MPRRPPRLAARWPSACWRRAPRSCSSAPPGPGLLPDEVPAVAADQPVPAPAAEQPVVAVVAADRVGPGETSDHVVPAQGADHVAALRPPAHVAPVGAGQSREAATPGHGGRGPRAV